MKIPRHAMMPTLDAAIEAFVGDRLWFLASQTKGLPRPPDRARDLLNTYAGLQDGVGVAIVVSGIVWVVFGLVARNGGIGFLLLPILLTVGTILFARWLSARRPDGPTPNTDFLAAALPRLGLLPVARRHAEALVAVYSGRASDPDGESLTLLRRLSDEEARLAAIARTIEGARSDEVAGEVARLRTRLESVGDPGAREALTRSLALAECRHGSATRADAMRERIEAHGDLLDQTSRTAAEALLGRRDPGTGLDDLRRNVAALGDEALALEAAVQEMRAL